MSLKYCQTNTLYQAGSGSIIGATSIVLTTLTDIYANVLTMTDFGAKGYGTLEPDTTNEEAFTFTGITANANGTYSLTGVSTALAKSPYTETSGTVRAHSGGTKVVISDTVAFWNTFLNKQNNETVVGKYTFPLANRPTMDTDADSVTATDLITLGQLSRQAISGASNASTTVKGIVQEATQAQVLAKTAAGSTGAELYINPSTLPDTLLSDYKADTGAADVYVITPAPAITAYTTGQRFSFKVSATNTTATPTLNVSGLGAKTIVKLGSSAMVAGDLVTGQIVEVEYDGTNFQLMSPSGTATVTKNTIKFGGDGSDGALAVSSGNTNIDCGNTAVVTKNYTSISITGTGSITFINPHANGTTIVLKSQGAVTLTSSTAPMIDASAMGATGGPQSTVSTNANVNGSAGNSTVARNFIHYLVGGGGAGTWNTTVGIAGAAPASALGVSLANMAFLKYPLLACGGGGASSGATSDGSGTVHGGAGGNGGGALVIECGGAWNFTTSNGISVAGAAGSAGSHTGTAYALSGGSGGGGGMCLVLYASLTANSGTINVAGGAQGGNIVVSGIGGPFYGPASGASPISVGTAGASASSGQIAQAGAAGYSFVAQNTAFV